MQNWCTYGRPIPSQHNLQPNRGQSCYCGMNISTIWAFGAPQSYTELQFEFHGVIGIYNQKQYSGITCDPNYVTVHRTMKCVKYSDSNTSSPLMTRTTGPLEIVNLGHWEIGNGLFRYSGIHAKDQPHSATNSELFLRLKWIILILCSHSIPKSS